MVRIFELQSVLLQAIMRGRGNGDMGWEGRGKEEVGNGAEEEVMRGGRGDEGRKR